MLNDVISFSAVLLDFSLFLKLFTVLYKACCYHFIINQFLKYISFIFLILRYYFLSLFTLYRSLTFQSFLYLSFIFKSFFLSFLPFYLFSHLFLLLSYLLFISFLFFFLWNYRTYCHNHHLSTISSSIRNREVSTNSQSLCILMRLVTSCPLDMYWYHINMFSYACQVCSVLCLDLICIFFCTCH